MAALEFTSRERQEVYRLIVLLNGSLQFIVLQLEELSANKILSSKYLKETLALTKKIETHMDALLEPKPKKR
ncbi:MAG TPA: hypothetical protein VFF39_08805 [Verrucomicrobiae bacterium]|jgi:hypothetical protein|nr:hypothetical protein [Verrucomicrobiae bacterium]